jgi:hypothetical protein
MPQHTDRHEVARKRVLYDAPGTAKVRIRTGVVYATTDNGVQTLDLYYPPDWDGGPAAPAVVFVSGASDIGAQRVLGCRINEMESCISWSRLAAASGLIGVTYTTGVDPVADTRGVMRYLRAHGSTCGIDPTRLGLWACSSHVPNALGQLMERQPSVRCGVLCYGYMLDLDGASGVAEAQKTWLFANPSAGRAVAELPPDTPLFIARAGQDAFPHVNDSIDRFVAHALRQNLPVTVVNHHAGPHAFDVDHDSGTTRDIVRQILTFLRSRLLDD